MGQKPWRFFVGFRAQEQNSAPILPQLQQQPHFHLLREVADLIAYIMAMPLAIKV
jgi:hypothetical protein